MEKNNQKTKEFIEKEKQHLDETVALLVRIRSKKRRTKIDDLACSTLLQNIYTGIENILRCILISKKIQLPKTDAWHKDMLSSAVENRIISSAIRNRLIDYLQFRHRHAHGYGYMLERDRMKPLIDEADTVVAQLFLELKAKGYL